MSEWKLSTSLITIDPVYGDYQTLQLRQDGNAWYYEIFRMLFGNAKLVLTDGFSVKDSW